MEFARFKFELRGDERHQSVYGDLADAESLPSGEFDLVTCMLGTICHLRREKARDDDELQRGLQALSGKVAEAGDLFLAWWEPTAGDPRPPLSIYTDRDARILLGNAPGFNEFRERARRCGLAIVANNVILGRLRVAHLTSIVRPTPC